MSHTEMRAILENSRSGVLEQQRSTEQAIRNSDGTQREEAMKRLIEIKQTLSNLEESLQWEARREVIPKLLAEMLEHKQSIQELLRDHEDKGKKESQLLAEIKLRLPELKKLLGKINEHWGCEDGVYRFYHMSFKVFHLQYLTLKTVDALIGLAPHACLHSWFVKIVIEGTEKEFAAEMNERWTEATRPIMEALFHARYFLEMVCKYGEELNEQSIQPYSGGQEPPRDLEEMFMRIQPIPSGWAAVLTLYGLR